MSVGLELLHPGTNGHDNVIFFCFLTAPLPPSGDALLNSLGLGSDSWSCGRAKLERALEKLTAVQAKAVLTILLNCATGDECKCARAAYTGGLL